MGYFLPNFAQYILWVKGGKIYTYAEPRTICKEKYKTCVHSNIRNLLQNNLANFNQTWRHNKSLSEWMQIIKTECLSSRAGIIRALL